MMPMMMMKTMVMMMLMMMMNKMVLMSMYKDVFCEGDILGDDDW